MEPILMHVYCCNHPNMQGLLGAFLRPWHGGRKPSEAARAEGLEYDQPTGADPGGISAEPVAQVAECSKKGV